MADSNQIQDNDSYINIEEIMHSAYLQYSLSVNIGRAIPDLRDGLKVGNRRILYAMKKLGLTKSHSFTKSAKVVGEVIGNYHPHGDQAVYDTLVRMAQDFAMRAPLIEGQGNFGSIDGDPPAAYRYTECRMERLAEELLADIDKDTVDMLPTFDEATQEPAVLPAKFPNLIVNGSTGIGVGMSTNIPPHNLGEIIDAIIVLLDNPRAQMSELLEHIKGPDFPTGAIVKGVNGFNSLYTHGRGVIKVRAKADIEENNGKERIIITEIPYAVNKENLVKKIADLVKDKKLMGISALRDETSKRTGIRIVVEIKQNAFADVVLNQLYAHTNLETGFAGCLLVIDKNRPKIMNLKQVLAAYIDHREEVITRRTRFELKKAQDRAHILEGLLTAVRNIDEVVKIIRSSENRKIASQSLIERFELTRVQANAILDMRLHQLTGLAIEDLQSEYDELIKQIEYLKSLLENRQLRIDLIKEELLYIKQKHADARKTKIEASGEDFSIADLIEEHTCVITVTNTGYIQRVPIDNFKTQHRGGKGVRGMGTKSEDFIHKLFVANSHDLIFFFSDKGNMYWLNVYEIPEGERTAKGKAIVNLINVDPGEKIRTMLTVNKDDIHRDDLYLTMATRDGYIKKTILSAFKNLRKTGIRAIKIEENDDLKDVEITNGNYEIFLNTKLGLACRFKEAEIKPTGRSSRGVSAIKFKLSEDELVSMIAINSKYVYDEEDNENKQVSDSSSPVDTNNENINQSYEPQILVISNIGLGKKSNFSSYRLTRRAAKGVRSMKLNEGEKIISALEVEEDTEIIISTIKGQTVRIPTNEIRTSGRASRGVRIMRLGNDDHISSVAKTAKTEVNEENH